MSTTKKFSQLDRIQTLDATDIFAVTDVDQTKSMKIQTDDLSNVILSDTNLTAKSETIRDKLNLFQSGVGNGLKAQELWDNGQYRNSTYFLNYDNLNNTPVRITELGQLGNSTEFVNYNSGSTLMEVSGTGATARIMTTDFLQEGVSNLYYTDERVVTQITQNFGTLFNSYSDTFDGGGVGDSLQDVLGTFQTPVSGQSAVIRVQDPTSTVRTNFTSGQVLRLYGASLTDSNIETAPAAGDFTVSVSTGFTDDSSVGNSRNFSYKIAFFNLKTGEVTPASSAKDVDVAYGGAVVYDDSSSVFNTDNFVSIDVSGYAVGNDPQGVLIYRKLIADSDWKLIAVLGDKDLPSWKDYHTFDYTDWSGKNSSDNSYNSITHFPLTSPVNASRGWTDVTISSIVESTNHFDIVLSSSCFINSFGGNVVQMAHNDTGLINAAITAKSTSGRRSLSLNAKTYNATHIDIPNDFGLIGTANITKIKKLPWSGYKGADANNTLISSIFSTNAQNISFVGIDFDGNVANQYLLQDSVDQTLNFLINLGSNPSSVIIDRSRFLNSVGAGIYATSPNQFKMTASEIVNSGVTDRYTFSPLVIDGGSTTIITGNRFENFTDNIDASITSEGAIANNIIKACGSGLFVYGSTFLVSSPNVLMGAANEFLASPDILNSEYDSINIYLEQLEDTPPWTSDVFAYQENGAAFDLAYSSTSINGAIVYRQNLVRQLSDGTSQIYGDKIGPAVKGIDGNTHNTFVVGKRYRIVEPGDANWGGIGAVNNLAGTEFISTGTTVSGSSGYATSSEFSGYSTNAPISWTDVPASASHIDRSKGQFQFQISDPDYTRLKTGIYAPSNLQTLYTANTQTSVSDATKIHPFGSSHVGVAWSASYRYDATVATITGPGAFSTTYTDPGGNTNYNASTAHPVYVGMPITPIVETPIAVGNYVRIFDHGTFALHQTPTTGDLGQIVAIGPDSATVTIKFWGCGDGSTSDGGCTNGSVNANISPTLNIIDDFVMAQGLIK